MRVGLVILGRIEKIDALLHGIGNQVADLVTEFVKEFMLALSREIGMTLHIKMLEGENTHHIIEGIFKCLARALAHACEIDRQFADEIPSTKGVL